MHRCLTISLLVLVALVQLGCGGSSSSPTLVAGSSPNISVSPATAFAGSADLDAIITASPQFSFSNAHHKINQVIWSVAGVNTVLTGTFVSNSQLSVQIPAVLLSNPVQAKVHVEVWDQQGDVPDSVSSSVKFAVTSVPAGVPVITSISPSSVPAGSPDLTITVDGANFINMNKYHTGLDWSAGGQETFLVTSYVSSTQLSAVIPAPLLANQGKGILTAQIWFFANDTPTAVSNQVTFTVTP